MRIVSTSKKEKVQLLDVWAAMLKEYRETEKVNVWALDDIQEAICDMFWTSKFSARKTHLKWVVYCKSYPKKFHYRGYRFQPRYNTYRKRKGRKQNEMG